mgnify:CR=1 FL=1
MLEHFIEELRARNIAANQGMESSKDSDLYEKSSSFNVFHPLNSTDLIPEHDSPIG